MSKRKPQKKKKKDEVNEPQGEYRTLNSGRELKKTITLASLDEMEEAGKNYSLSLSILQRMSYLLELNAIAYGIPDFKKLWKKEIKIKKA